ncbi:MAG: hypothetical protein ACD_2C00112G0004 [uncultured bacterium (gcode 4)]|uniref:Uncharacterized protein n=1 Tax=uncultured bacterium (gcode 4) TaxID=1234023 RepID=K2GH31_9BACT|nr:MAG: hypothetical protein ACD_2C00112G0004 [uncultured bacterium (gcode 4)]
MVKRRWNSIAEVIIIITILTFWLVWAYSVLNSGQKLSISTENRIKWTNIAREWIEIMQNIRDSNWIKFSSDYTHCWNVRAYNSSCIWTDNTNWIAAQSYTLSFTGWLWHPIQSTSWALPFNTAYRNDFYVNIDANWLISQDSMITTPCSASLSKNCRTIFTRQITVSYPDGSISTKRMKVNSIVKWVDNASSWVNVINLQTILTNWREDI